MTENLLLVSTLLAASLVTATPAPYASCVCTQTFLVNFDNLAPTPPLFGTGPPPFTTSNLLYTGFNILNQNDGAPSPRLSYHSEPQAIEGSGIGNLIEFDLSNANISIQGTIASFDLHSFWFGCEIPAPGQRVTVPANCAVNVTGVTVEGHSVGPSTFQFGTGVSFVGTEASGPLVSGMAKAVLSDEFHGLTNVTLVGVEPVGLVFVYSVLYDDLSYTTHDVCCKG